MKLDETSERPNGLAGQGCGTLTNPGSPDHYIKTECWAFPGVNRWGNLARNALIGPGVSKLDVSVFKNNRIRRISETFNAQFRAEFFTFSTMLTSPRLLTMRRSSIKVGTPSQVQGLSPLRKQFLFRFSLP
jgi:hypothetical protein